jgi:hypothetical protein
MFFKDTNEQVVRTASISWWCIAYLDMGILYSRHLSVCTAQRCITVPYRSMIWMVHHHLDISIAFESRQ